MSELPSRYSDRGLTERESHQVITSGSPRKNRPIGAIKIEDRVNDVLEQAHYYDQDQDVEGDIQMIEVDDEQEVQIIANYVTDKRTTSDLDYSRFTPKFQDLPDDENYNDLQSENKPERTTYMVVDTNFILSHLSIIDALAKLHVKYHHKIVIPITVVKELDGLKGSNRLTGDKGIISETTVGHLARWANSWIYQQLADLKSSVRAQKLREVIDRTAIKDDAILDCCLYLQEKENALVILLSNDKNLCMKALANEVLTVSYRKGMTAFMIASKAFQENQFQSRIHNPRQHSTQKQDTIHQYQQNYNIPYESNFQNDKVPDLKYGTVRYNDLMDVDFSESETTESIPDTPNIDTPIQNSQRHLISIQDFHKASDLIYREVQSIVLDAIDWCMFEEYGEDMDIVGYDKSKVTKLVDSSKILIKYWVSVFTEYFQKRSFKPFSTTGKKSPRFVHSPRHGPELTDFVDYWSDVLRVLYFKRDDKQNQALEKIIERWTFIAKPLKDQF